MQFDRTHVARAHHRTRHLGHRAAVLGVAAITAGGVAALPAAALAASSPTITRTQKVTVKPLALAKGRTVTVKVKVTNPETKVSSWWSKSAVAKTVQTGINGGKQTPYQSQGFTCKPVIRGEHTNFTCTLRGADVPTTVTLTFSVIYRGDTSSG